MDVVSENQNDRIDTSDERTCRKRKNEINGKEKWFVFNSIFKEERYEQEENQCSNGDSDGSIYGISSSDDCIRR